MGTRIELPTQTIQVLDDRVHIRIGNVTMYIEVSETSKNIPYVDWWRRGDASTHHATWETDDQLINDYYPEQKLWQKMSEAVDLSDPTVLSDLPD